MNNAMIETIKSQALSTEFYTPEKCYITELSNSIDDPELSIARARVKPGISTHWHRLDNTQERYYILSGMGQVEIGQQAAKNVTAGDTVLIPAMCRQRISNIGNEDLIFLAICTPRFRNEVYQDLEPVANKT